MIQFKLAEGEHIDDFKLATGVLVQFLEKVERFLVLFNFDQILSSCVYCLALVLLSILHDPLMNFY